MSNETEVKLHETTDAVVWAKEFMRIFEDRKQDIDESLMISWFANSICTAEDLLSSKINHKLYNAYDIIKLLEQDHELKPYVETYDNGNTQDFGLCWMHKETGQYYTHKGLEHESSYLIELGIDSHLSHGLGFNSKEQKWFGWSHRAIYGFTIGSKVKKGDCAYSPSNKDELIELLITGSGSHEITYSVTDDILEIVSIFKGYDDDKSQDKFIGNKNINRYKLSDKGYYVIEEMVQCGDTECTWKGKQSKELSVAEELPLEAQEHTCNYIESEPEYHFVEWGKGEWEAKTIEEAKQMAIDFSRGVS